MNDDTLQVPDCDGNLGRHYWLGDGVCDDGSDGLSNFNCKPYMCDKADCGTEC